MKKITALFFALLFVAIIPFNTYAVAEINNIYNIDKITIIFATDSSLTSKTQANIAEAEATNDMNLSALTTYNLLCTIFGHKTTIESYTVIEHCVSSTAPRCLESIKDITICTRCETLIDMQTVTSNYIFCCD